MPIAKLQYSARADLQSVRLCCTDCISAFRLRSMTTSLISASLNGRARAKKCFVIDKTIVMLVIGFIFIVLQSCTHNEDILYSDAWIDLPSIQNARQLGGYPTKGNRFVKRNMILRTGELAALSDRDKSVLINEYRLAHILDLRDEVEVANYPDPIIEGVQYHHLNVWPREVRNRLNEECTTANGFDSELFIQKYYTVFAVEPAAIKAFKEMFVALLNNATGSVLIHCVHGKDRSGAATALILSALDVEWKVIEKEYLLSNTAYPGSVDISSLRYYKSVIEKNYGSIEKYLKTAMNLDDNDILALREKYTTDRQP